MTKDTSQKIKEKYVMICPKCKSFDVDMDKSNPVQPAYGLPPMYVCNKCEHLGYAFPEVILSEIDEFEKEVKNEGLNSLDPDKTSKVDIRYGVFEVKILWKFIAPIIVIVGIFIFKEDPVFGIIFTLAGILMFYITYFKK